MRLFFTSSSKVLYLRLLSFTKPYWGKFVISILCMILYAISEPLLPALMKPLMDGSFVEKDSTSRILIPIYIVILFLIRGIFNYISDISMHWVAQQVVMDTRQAMFKRIISLPSSYFDDSTSGELVSKLSYDVTQVSQAATRCITIVIQDTLGILGLVGYMVYLNWRLSFTILIIAPLVGLVVSMISVRLRTMSRNLQKSMGAITQVAQEAIECQKVVKIFGGQDHEVERFHTATNQVRKFTMKVVKTSAANIPLIQLIMAIALAIMVYFSASQAAAGLMTIGDFVSFFTAMTLMLPRVKRLAGVNEHLQRGLAAAESVFDILDEPEEPNPGVLEVTRAAGEISFHNVSFAYTHSQSEALSNINLHISAGETVAIVGASGSGKSTLVNLIPRFYAVTQGVIKLDGIPIDEIKLTSLRKNISLVTQDVVLFNGTIRDNIAYGLLRNVSDEEIEHASRAAFVDDFVDTLPDRYATFIGDNGIRLSGGQRQRIAIARALLKDAPILIFDEATSALDTASEKHIQSALETLRKGRTCIIIAHRLSTVEKANRIIVLKQGKIAEIGTHQSLIRKQGIYAELHKIQFIQQDGEHPPQTIISFH